MQKAARSFFDLGHPVTSKVRQNDKAFYLGGNNPQGSTRWVKVVVSVIEEP